MKSDRCGGDDGGWELVRGCDLRPASVRVGLLYHGLFRDFFRFSLCGCRRFWCREFVLI